MANLNYKLRLKNLLFRHCSPINHRIRLIDDKKFLFEELFRELMVLERWIKRAPLEVEDPTKKKNGPTSPEEILYWRFIPGFVYLPDWSGFSKGDLIHFKSRFEQLIGRLII